MKTGNILAWNVKRCVPWNERIWDGACWMRYSANVIPTGPWSALGPFFWAYAMCRTEDRRSTVATPLPWPTDRR